MTKPKKRKRSDKQLTLPEAHEAWERFWANTRIIGFEVDEEGEKKAIRTNIQRIMPPSYGRFDFKNNP